MKVRSARRGAGNRIRGPQSALTDFLAANNISAAQIRDDYNRRLREAQDQAGEGTNGDVVNGTGQADENGDDGHDSDAAAAAADAALERSAKRKRGNAAALAKVKESKKRKSKGKRKRKKGSDDDDDDDSDFDVGELDTYKKVPKLPGQLENCEICDKRFTVTPYSKTGPDGGLVCAPCGKVIAADQKAAVNKNRTAARTGRGRRKVESNRLDGLLLSGPKTLQQLCIEKLAQHSTDIEEFGDLPAPLLDRLSLIFTKKRVLTPHTLDLFLRSDFDSVTIHDCSYLETADYNRIFAMVPRICKLVLGNAGQFKDENVAYMIEKARNVTFLQLYAANLITNPMWNELITTLGPTLEALKLKWLDAAFEDETVALIAQNCRNLKRLKLKLCRRIGTDAIASIAKMPGLEHLSLQISEEVPSENLVHLVENLGVHLRTLSLESFADADADLLAAIGTHCRQLRKLRLSYNDVFRDADLAALFDNWQNPPLEHADFAATRDVDNTNPEGPEAPDATGLASDGFLALMRHSGTALRRLNLASCRHISLRAFLEAFDVEAGRTYPALRDVDVSFCGNVDDAVLAALFRACPRLRTVAAFGCFKVEDAVVPRGIVLLGATKAQEAVEIMGNAVFEGEGRGRLVPVAS